MSVKVTINGENKVFERAFTLLELVAHLGLYEKSVFIEYNREPLEREHYKSMRIKDGDNLEIVRMMAGG